MTDWISEAALAEGVARLRAAVDAAPADQGPVTYFEALTAIALDYFARGHARWVVLETGLGGRLDATNAAQPTIAVLTPISLDHTEVLGTTLTAIAEEKAAIIKPGQIVISAAQPPEAAAVIRRRCATVQATLVMAGEQFSVSAAHVNRQGATCTVRGRLATYSDVRLLLLGRHQVDNAAVACAVMEAVTEQDGALALSVDALRVGLTQVEWPGRGEWLPGTPPLLLDGAHNGASAEALRALLDDVFPGQRVGVIFGTSSDKDVAGMVAALRPRVTTWWATQAAHPRALTADALAHRLRAAGVTAPAIPSLREALTAAQRSDCTLLVVTGSLFIVGEARALLTEAPVS